MIFRAGSFAVFPIVVISFCAPLSNNNDRFADLPHPGMKKIPSAGRSFQQGWNDTRASLDEKPGMRSGFTYDYWIDSTEVTQKEYYDITGKRPVSSGSTYGLGDAYPVYCVSWFDAALYCNSRSKAEGLDTVYVYSGIKSLPSGTVYDLTGLRYDMTRDGYRLPTESEWEYAARGGSTSLPFSSVGDSSYACYYAWFGANSSGRTHPVATRIANGYGLYDMAGNVFEWTNDWKCFYNGREITNSLGALQPGGENEKVIKGGSYNYGLLSLRPSGRSATYATTLSSANEYVGFRCARGPVSNGQYIGVSPTDFTPNPVTIMTNAGDLRLFTRASGSKLVFVNVTGTNRTLCYVDFSRSFSYSVEYLDDRNVYMPTISPDGKYVAYCSRNEGQSGSSMITIRSLDSLNSPLVTLTADPAFIPRWWVGESAQDTFIVYTNSAMPNGNEALWRTTKTYLQKMSGGRPVGSPEELVSNGSYHDGLSQDRRYLVTGYNRLMVRNLVTNEEHQSFLSPLNGKDANGSSQVCNVSVSPDTGSSVRCMFLDFGYPRTSTITNSSYGIHEYLFVSTMGDSVVSYMRCPSGETSWDYTEWSNQAGFGVGCGRNGSSQAHAIYAIDLDQKSYRQMVTGTELQQPYLWTTGTIAPSEFSLDSLGQYNNPLNSSYQNGFASKILMFWHIFDSLEIAIIGSSQAILGLDPARIVGYYAFNLAFHGGDLLGQKNIILNYLINHCPHLKVICSSLDIGWIANPNGNLSWEQGVGQSKGYIYDSCHAFWNGAVSSDFKKTMNQIPFPVPFPMEELGFIGASSQNWGDVPPSTIDDNVLLWTIADLNCQQNLATISMLADTVRSKKIHWVMINFPVSPHYQSTDSYSYWGPSKQTAQDVLMTLREMDSTNDFFHFYDANNDGNHDYGEGDAFDENHLSAAGAAKLSVRVDSIIHSILQ
jgi:uncharacterized protein (TIGR02171 family)